MSMYSTYTVDNLMNISYHYRSCLHLASEIVDTMFNKRTSCLLLGMYIYNVHVIITCMSATVGVYMHGSTVHIHVYQLNVTIQ